jgi:ubiquinone/menaquinone biosynthesis C-methylase UbiE
MTQHQHHDQDAVITRPHAYECGVAVCFLGRRGRTYDRLVRLAGVQTGDRVLDIGCGTGFLTRRAARATGPTGRVIGVDPSTPVVEYARRNSPAWCAYHVAPGDLVPEPDETFDVAVSSLALHHVAEDRRTATLDEMHRLVRPGGRLLIAEFRPPQGKLLGKLLNPVERHGMKHLPLAGLADDIGAAGFTVTESGKVWPLMSYVAAVRS